MSGSAEQFERIEVQTGYDRWARFYDEDPNPLVHLETPFADALLGEVRGRDVLDVGCGTGRHAIRLAGRGAVVTALDFSIGMLERARERAGGLPVSFCQHDLSQPLPAADASFDRVICGLVLDHIANLEQLFAEMCRVSRPDGYVVISVMHPAMSLRGVQARFREPVTGEKFELSSQVHQMSDYVMAAVRGGFRFDHFSEHSPDSSFASRFPRAEKYVGWPLLLMMGLTCR